MFLVTHQFLTIIEYFEENSHKFFKIRRKYAIPRFSTTSIIISSCVERLKAQVARGGEIKFKNLSNLSPIVLGNYSRLACMYYYTLELKRGS